MTNEELMALATRINEEWACCNADGVMLSKGILRLLSENSALRDVVTAANILLEQCHLLNVEQDWTTSPAEVTLYRALGKVL